MRVGRGLERDWGGRRWTCGSLPSPLDVKVTYIKEPRRYRCFNFEMYEGREDMSISQPANPSIGLPTPEG